jgi:hypothetical protein
MKHLKILLPVFLLISGISFSNFNQEKAVFNWHQSKPQNIPGLK